MLSWWDSLEAVTNVTWWLRWIGASLTIAGGLCVIATLAGSKRVETLKNKRDVLKQEEGESKEKALRARLEAAEERQRDRRLTDEQRILIKQALQASPKGRIVIISMTDSTESHRYATDFDEVLREAGWTSRVQPILRLSEGPPPTGLILAMENPQAIPPYINPLFKALKNANVPAEAQTAPKLIQDEPITLVVGYKQ